MHRVPQRTWAAVAAFSASAGLATVAVAQWTVTNLHPAGATYSTAVSVHAGQQVGHVIIGGVRRASLWSGTAASWVDLHPPGANWSEAFGVHGGKQVGHARIGDIFQPFRASLWSGTAASRVDLHPAGATGSSTAYAIFSGQQAGSAEVGEVGVASLWSGTAASWQGLEPQGSAIFGLSAEQQVGVTSGHGASLWSGTSESWVNLQPAGPLSSVAYGVDAGEQVGHVLFPGFINRAALWRGTAESFVDLSPPGSTHTAAWGIHAGLQVGSAMINEVHRASLWRGTPESWEDLSLALPGSWDETQANSIWSNGTTIYIVGHGRNLATGRFEALLWTRPLPVPADLDGDGDVDMDDFEIFRKCATGAAVPYDPASLPPGCELTPNAQGIIAADLDSDNDVDQSDFGLFQRCFSGADQPADPQCPG